MNRELLYKAKFNEDSLIEGRRFYVNEEYPVYQKDDKYVVLVAENGDFCFSSELMEQAISQWELEVVA